MKEAKVPPHQQRTVRRIAQRRQGRCRQTLRGTKGLEALPIVAKDPVFSADPKKTRAVLVNPPHRQIAESLIVAKGAEAILLRANNPSSRQQQRKNTRIGLAFHYYVKSAAAPNSFRLIWLGEQLNLHSPRDLLYGFHGIPREEPLTVCSLYESSSLGYLECLVIAQMSCYYCS